MFKDELSGGQQTQPLIDIYTYEFADLKEYNRFIKNCKNLIRSSWEYSIWTRFIKSIKNLCQFTKESTFALTVDIHHHPFSLENIVKIVCDRQLSTKGRTTTFDIAKEVMELHYKNKVGYVLMIKSLHEKFHNGYLNIPIELVSGDWKYLEENYTIPDDIAKVVEKYKAVTLENCPRLKWDGDYIIYDE